MAEEEETLEMDEVLEQVVAYAVDEAKESLIQTGEFTPFTIVVEGDNMHIESFPGDDPESIRANARDNVRTASTFASHYAFCYDGFIETDGPTLDAIVVECADNEQEEAFAIVCIYQESDEGEGTLEFEDELAYVGEAESFFDRDVVAHAVDQAMASAEEELAHQRNQEAARRRLEEMKASEEN